MAPLSWLGSAILAWVLMGTALLAAATAGLPEDFVFRVAAVLLLALPGALFLNASSFEPRTIRLGVLAVAAALGLLETVGILTSTTQPFRLDDTVYALGLIVRFFLWVMAFRAFTLTTARDLTLSLVPALSTIVLAVIVTAGPMTMACVTVFIVAAVGLLARDRRATWAACPPPEEIVSSLDDPAAVSSPDGPASARVRAWPAWATLHALVIACALLAGLGLSHWTTTWSLGARLRVNLAYRLARWFMHERVSVTLYSFHYLGQPEVRRSRQPVFTVHSENPEPWRQGALDTYKGYKWIRDRWGAPERLLPDRAGRFTAPPSDEVPSAAEPQAERTHTIALAVHCAGALVAPYRPVSIDVAAPKLRVSHDGIVSVGPYLGPGVSYSVTSQPMSARPAMGSSGAADVPDWIRQGPYLGARDEPVPERVGRLAQQVVAGLPTAFEKARALEQHLRDNYTYTRTPGRIDWHSDVVDTFLFETRRGYCDHFASAMAVLCRQVGLPSRFVVGYREGEAAEDEEDVYLVRDNDAHSWVEVYFAEAGWIAFDPTPAAEAAELELSWWERLTKWRERMAQRVRDGTALTWASDPALMLPLVLWAVVQAAALAYCARRAGWRIIAGRGAALRGPPRHAVQQAYAEMLRRFRRVGLEHQPQDTPSEFAQAAAALVPGAATAVACITNAHILMTYAGRGMERADAHAVMTALGNIRTALRAARRSGSRAP